ncbi:MAG: TerC family protein [Candidatus Dadabacteria bacterium]|nr:MAG: TerC family protein [Candidatus Dadabacteria bacterium]
MDMFTNPDLLIGLLTLTALEIVLGIDNIIFISILASRLPEHQRNTARLGGLGLAVFTRIGLLLSLSWLMGLTEPWFTVRGLEFSGRDLILAGGGLFLLAKSTFEIHANLVGTEHAEAATVPPSLALVLVQIMALDVVFSFDSVITAVGMVSHLPTMITAVIVAVLIMMAWSGAVGRFIERHPTFKMLALSFLILIGVSLIGEAFGHHIPKGYIYFAMGFSVLVELLNMRIRDRHAAHTVHLQRFPDEAA